MDSLDTRLRRHTAPYLACFKGIPQDEVWESPFTFQSFNDRKASGEPQPALAHLMHGSLEDHAENLERLNQAGAGVFIAVNETDLKGRKKDNIQNLRGWWVDLDEKDGWEAFDAAALPLPPTMTIRTPGGWHIYWLSDGPMPCESPNRRSAHEAEVKAIALALAPYGGDVNACDVARVLRVPGFYHHKGEAQLVELVDASGPRYTREQIRAAFPPQEAMSKPGASPPLPAGQPYPGRADAMERAGRYAESLPPALSGQGGHNATFQAALKIQDGFNLSEDEALAIMADHFNPRCAPPWTLGELRRKVREAAPHCQNRGHLLRESRPAQGTSQGAPAPMPEAPLSWPPPHPLTSKVDAQPYPIDSLPQAIRAAVEEVRGFVKAPVSMVAASALSAVSLAVQAHFDMKRAEGLSGPVGLFFLTIAESGERKSTCDGFFTKAAREYEAQQAEAARPLLKDFAAASGAWEAKVKGIQDAIRRGAAKPGADIRGLEFKLRDAERDKPQGPRVPRLIYSDATPESLKWSLAKAWPSGAVISSEAGIVFGAHGMGSDSVMRNLSTLNQLWDGADIATERRTSESFTVRGARLTIALQVQGPTLRTFMDQSGALARGSGFLARFLVALPESTQGHRPFTDPPAFWPSRDAFNRRIAEILERPAPIGEEGALTPAMLTFTSEAKAAWVSFHDRIEAQLGDGGDYQDVRDVASKIADNAARLAALFHVFEGGQGIAVGADHFKAAARVAEWHLNESRRFFGEMALPAGLADAERLETWLINRCAQTGGNQVPTKDVQQRGPAGLREKARIDAAMVELEELGRAQRVHEGRRKFLAINPDLLIRSNSRNSSSNVSRAKFTFPLDAESDVSGNSSNSGSTVQPFEMPIAPWVCDL